MMRSTAFLIGIFVFVSTFFTGMSHALECPGGASILNILSPVKGQDWRNPEDQDFAALLDEKKGMYANLCTGLWLGMGSPSTDCASYCQGSLNVLESFRTELTNAYKDQAETKKQFESECASPKLKDIRAAEAAKVLGVYNLCNYCTKRDFVKQTQEALTKCIGLYKQKWKEELNPALSKAESSGAQ